MSLPPPKFDGLPLRGAITIGMVTAVAVVGSFAVEARGARYLIDKQLDAERLQVEGRVASFEGALARAADSARRYASAVSYRTEDLATEPDTFESLARRDADGAWRSVKEGFHAETDAGVWVPPEVALDADTRRFFLRARRQTALFGLGALNELFVDTWALPLTNGEVIFFPSTPSFIYDAPATLDYRDTEWVQLTSPEVNPTGQPRWTSSSYDPAARQWMISVVAPFTKDGQWAGAVGHDMLLSQLFAALLGDTTDAATLAPLYVAKQNGELLMRENGVPSVGDTIPEPYRRLASGVADAQQVGGDYVMAARLPTLDATVLYRVNGDVIHGSLHAALANLQLAQALATLLIVVGAYQWVARDARRGSQRQAALEAQNLELEALVEARTRSLTQTNAQLEQLMLQDHLTGLGNRRMFELSLQTAWQRDLRRQRPLAVLMVDVDHFKSYNDQQGHHAGDLCLQAVAKVLASSALRPDDVAARYGGEEFVLVLPDTDEHGARHVAERLQRRLAALDLPHPGAAHGRVTVSVGIATTVPTPGVEPHSLVRCADAALYEAKQRGRNRWHLSDLLESCRAQLLSADVAIS